MPGRLQKLQSSTRGWRLSTTAEVGLQELGLQPLGLLGLLGGIWGQKGYSNGYRVVLGAGRSGCVCIGGVRDSSKLRLVRKI